MLFLLQSVVTVVLEAFFAIGFWVCIELFLFPLVFRSRRRVSQEF